MAASERAAGGENAVIPVWVRWFDYLIVSRPRGHGRSSCSAPGSARARSDWTSRLTSTGMRWITTRCSRPRKMCWPAACRGADGKWSRARPPARRRRHRHHRTRFPVMQPYRARCTRNGVLPPFGTDDPLALFTAGGWQLDHVTAPVAPDVNYGRLLRAKAGTGPHPSGNRSSPPPAEARVRPSWPLDRRPASWSLWRWPAGVPGQPGPG